MSKKINDMKLNESVDTKDTLPEFEGIMGENMNIAQKKGDECQNTSCKYCSKVGHLCRFGLRNIGCYIENDVVSSMADDFLKSVESGLG